MRVEGKGRWMHVDSAEQTLVLASAASYRINRYARTYRSIHNLAPDHTSDTKGYLSMPLHSPTESLNHIRTMGYPIFLQATGVLSSSYRATPYCQLGVHFLAVFVFCASLRRMGISDAMRTIMASSLIYSNTAIRYTSVLTADALANNGPSPHGIKFRTSVDVLYAALVDRRAVFAGRLRWL